jgi:hypothetical protein
VVGRDDAEGHVMVVVMAVGHLQRRCPIDKDEIGAKSNDKTPSSHCEGVLTAVSESVYNPPCNNTARYLFPISFPPSPTK